MMKNNDYCQDDKTVLVSRHGHAPASNPMTDSTPPPRFEQLEERMIYAARLRPAETFNVGMNPLVAAASELLSEVVRLKSGDIPQDMAALHEHLTQVLKTFEARALHNGAENSQVAGARYVLCTALDEAVVTSGWGDETEWSQMSLLSRFHQETFGGEKFFQLLDRLSKNPVKHLPMLELMYLCLSLGFEGRYRVQTRGVQELEHIRDAVFRQIRQLRGDAPRELSPHWEGLSNPRRSLVRIVPGWMVVGFTLVCLVVMYSGFAWVLGEHRNAVLQPYQPFDQPAVNPQSQSQAQAQAQP
jgi:type VI secretion system protein ImpK